MRGQKNEAELRRQFIDPFFKAMGWDVDNNQGYSEAYKEVSHEEPIKIRGKTYFLDYAFRIGGQTKFILEAKKPGVNIKEDVGAALQLRRYAWNSDLKMSILTDFEEFAVYDCTVPIGKNDTAATARIAYFTYEGYPKKWDWIESIFSQESIKRGSFDRYVESKKGKRGTARVDEAFLADIEKWRDLLARNIALRNTISKEGLNTVVQRTIDRIVFLRICEDRGIEKYGRLGDLTKNGDIYPQLCRLFQEADDRYNSGIFHFHEEQGRPEMPDTISLSLTIDDKVLKEIIGRLYYPESPYEFSLIPTEILGHVYEQFLGKVIRLTDGGRAKVEYKPEVRKAGGVFYTPSYIVEYIVKKTVGKLVEGKTPKEVADLHILDPACGSGSFLIGAYQFLLDWHRDWYIEHLVPVIKEKGATSKEVQALIPVQLQPKARGRGKPRKLQVTDLPIYAAGNGNGSRVRSDWRLTSAERKRILLNNIYGVDIDTQAVEVTKLSLLLKVLEGENEETVSKQLTLFQERALPSLHQNIKCGNSLIGPDILTDEKAALSAEEIRQINPFDWHREFSAIMSNGGFDAVIGNPPYVRIQEMKKWAPFDVEFYKKRYSSAKKGNYDIYIVFVEKGLTLINNTGLLGYILPHKFFNAKYGENIRKIIKNGNHIEEIVHFGHQQVFERATTYTCLLFLSKSGNDSFRFKKVNDLNKWEASKISIDGEIPINNIPDGDWNFVVGSEKEIFQKLEGKFEKLGNYTEKIAQGIRTSANKIYVLDLVSENETAIVAYSSELEEKIEIEKDLLKNFLQGKEIRRYSIDYSNKIVIIPYYTYNGKTQIFKKHEIKEKYPMIFSYLSKNKSFLENREDGKMKGDEWYAFVYPKNIEFMNKSKILVPDIAASSSFSLDENGDFAYTSGYGIILKSSVNIDLKFILGLLNSKLLDYYMKIISTEMRGGYIRYFSQYIEKLPIPNINFSNHSDVARHDRMVGLVDRMLALHREREEVRDGHARELIERQIEATDAEIDRLVYELYGLTDEEIRIVEGR